MDETHEKAQNYNLWRCLEIERESGTDQEVRLNGKNFIGQQIVEGSRKFLDFKLFKQI